MAKSFGNETYFLTAVLSFLFSYLIITFGFFPSFGLSLSLTIFALFTNKYVLKSPDTKLFFALSLAFSALLFIRSEPVVTFFNFWAAIFFGVLMLTSSAQKYKGFVAYLYLPISLFFNALQTTSKYYPKSFEENNYLKKTKVSEVLFGVLVSIFVLALILPLLSSSNPIFENLLKNLLNIFDLEYVSKWGVQIVFFLTCLTLIPKLLTLIEKGSDHDLPSVFKLQTFPLQIPKAITSIVLVLFFITQFQLYFTNELSLSQRAREVFGQLSVVAVIVFVLIYNSDLKTKLSQQLNWLLGIEGIFLTLMAYKSVFEYIAAHGLTYKRLYGIVFATLIAGVFILYKIYLQKSGNFARQAIFFSASTLLFINLINFDFLIYHFNQPNLGYEVDYQYLSTLSPDSLSYSEQFKQLEDFTFNKNISGNYENKNPFIILHKIESLQQKYSSFDFREFNLLDYIQYLKIKDINTSPLRAYYENEQPTY